MALVILIHAVVFLAFWLTNLPYQESLDNFLIGATGLRTNFLLIFMVFAGLMALWSAARLALRRDVHGAGSAVLPDHWHFLSGLLLRQLHRLVSKEPGQP